MTPAAAVLQVRGQSLVLHPERAVEWREQRSVIVADTHFGKSSIFRRHGIPVPDGSDEHDRQRLGALLQRVDAARLIVLGDFLHGPLIGAPEAAALEAWCAALHPVQIHVVAGNHDRGAAMRWETVLHWREAAWQEGPFTFTHEAGPVTCDDGQWMMSGHIHPVVRLGGLRKQGARVPVFWQRAGGLVLPAFGIFTGGFVINPKPGERVFAVGPDRVVPF